MYQQVFIHHPSTGASCKFLGCLANAKDLVARVEGHGLGGEEKPANGWQGLMVGERFDRGFGALPVGTVQMYTGKKMCQEEQVGL